MMSKAVISPLGIQSANRLQQCQHRTSRRDQFFPLLFNIEQYYIVLPVTLIYCTFNSILHFLLRNYVTTILLNNGSQLDMFFSTVVFTAVQIF